MPDDNLADWTFEVREVSVGVYRGSAQDRRGRSVELTRADPDELLELLRERAAEMVRSSE